MPSINNTQIVFNDATTQNTSTAGYFTGSNQSLTANGYQRLPNGGIIQWGSGTAGTRVTFPLAFPNACRSVVSVGDNGAGGSGLTARCTGVNTTGFDLSSDVCCSNIARNRYWIAIGY